MTPDQPAELRLREDPGMRRTVRERLWAIEEAAVLISRRCPAAADAQGLLILRQVKELRDTLLA